MSLVGGDPEQLASLRALFESQAGQVQELTSAIRNQLANTNWQGPTADRFRDTWHTEYERVLNALSQALVDAGQEVQRAYQKLMQY